MCGDWSNRLAISAVSPWRGVSDKGERKCDAGGRRSATRAAPRSSSVLSRSRSGKRLPRCALQLRPVWNRRSERTSASQTPWAAESAYVPDQWCGSRSIDEDHLPAREPPRGAPTEMTNAGQTHQQPRGPRIHMQHSRFDLAQIGPMRPIRQAIQVYGHD